MELTDLKVFITIAEEGSISRAAERMDYVQSNVTARIRKLESELGILLFHRNPKGVTLTEKGTLFRNYAISILNMAEEAIREVQETAYPSGPLAIGIVETVTCGNFMNKLSDFQSRHPDVSLSISTGSSAELLSKVLNHQLDGAFVTGDMRSPQLNFEYMMQDEIVLLTPKAGDAYPALSVTKWAVFPKGCPFRAILEEWLHSEGIPLVNIIEINSLETLLSCVRSGLASTLLPDSVLTGEYKLLGSHPVPAKFRFTTTSLVRRNDRFSSKALTAFVEMVKVNGF
ncbi:LysR family transcriptional regulator [Paenibacillus radicis (ex Xue et al. 2023)]|uniref:LysR family transcriptional regulator n=1 Tax=Paenibacillus radicis (ex Xue et al. 2023) TaxID=2972489 RepID=A0ABT1YU88_9BACL|nr:LysR family transcriptional regulator [Paenibacillus radicis (ex Xue et al. 2023)]MCR8635580.1 LysR family transcriptional regulator [Paenibacillus radicis (ex Xue et al. 2023)]